MLPTPAAILILEATIAATSATGPPLREVVPSGLEAFRHVSGEARKQQIYEATSGGVCVLDYDDDGWVDIYLVNGGQLEMLKGNRPSLPSRLFRNDHGRFVDVTERAGVGNPGSWGQGCAAADYDRDGRVDLYVTNLGANRLYRNDGDGTFSDRASEAGVAHASFSTGAAWADYDADGDLDLYVANYVEVGADYVPLSQSGRAVSSKFCQFLGRPVYCGPRGLKGAQDVLYRNEGNGRFTDVTVQAGMAERTRSYGMGAVWADFDDDGRLDLFVANDMMANYLYRNLGDGRFEEMGYASGTALSQDAREQASMGVAAQDYDGDGRVDLLVTNFSHDYNTLYRNLGGGHFQDVTATAGLVEPAMPYLGWGTFFFDYDNDGDLDILVVNGHVYPEVDTWPSGTTYLQRKLLHENMGGGRFRDVSPDQAGDWLAKREGSRGAAYLDYDNDGRLDVVVNNLDGQPMLIHNEQGQGHYLLLRLRTGGRDAVGARASIRTGARWQHRVLHAGESYLSQNDPRVHFGLGTASLVDEMKVVWPSGKVTTRTAIRADQILTIREE